MRSLILSDRRPPREGGRRGSTAEDRRRSQTMRPETKHGDRVGRRRSAEDVSWTKNDDGGVQGNSGAQRTMTTATTTTTMIAAAVGRRQMAATMVDEQALAHGRMATPAAHAPVAREARPDVMYEKIAADTMMEQELPPPLSAPAPTHLCQHPKTTDVAQVQFVSHSGFVLRN